jgi:hypothetical protein
MSPRFLLPLALPILLSTPLPHRAAFDGATERGAPAACHSSYPDFCIPPPPPDLDCPDIRGKKPFRVRGADPHGFDRDRDGWACEPRPRRRN